MRSIGIDPKHNPVNTPHNADGATTTPSVDATDDRRAVRPPLTCNSNLAAKGASGANQPQNPTGRRLPMSRLYGSNATHTVDASNAARPTTTLSRNTRRHVRHPPDAIKAPQEALQPLRPGLLRRARLWTIRYAADRIDSAVRCNSLPRQR